MFQRGSEGRGSGTETSLADGTHASVAPSRNPCGRRSVHLRRSRHAARCAPIPARGRSVARRRRHRHVVARDRLATRRQRRGVEHRRSRAGRVPAPGVRRSGRSARRLEHVRREPLPSRGARSRRPRRSVERRRGPAREAIGRRAGGRLDGPARREAGAVRTRPAGGGVRGLPGAGRGARRGRRRPPGDRDPDGPAGDGAGARRRARGCARPRGPRERDVHPGRPHPARLDARAGRGPPGRPRNRRDRRELRRGPVAGAPARSSDRSGRRRGGDRVAAQRRRPRPARRSVRVSGDPAVRGRAGARRDRRGRRDRRRMLRHRAISHRRDRRGDARAWAERPHRDAARARTGAGGALRPRRSRRPSSSARWRPDGSWWRSRWNRRGRRASPP